MFTHLDRLLFNLAAPTLQTQGAGSLPDFLAAAGPELPACNSTGAVCPPPWALCHRGRRSFLL